MRTMLVVPADPAAVGDGCGATPSRSRSSPRSRVNCSTHVRGRHDGKPEVRCSLITLSVKMGRVHCGGLEPQPVQATCETFGFTSHTLPNTRLGEFMSSLIKDVEKLLERWFAALETGDPSQVTALYAKDAILLATFNGDVKKGHREIRGYFEREFLPKHPVGMAVEAYTRVLDGVAVNSGLYSFQVDSKDEGRATVEARYTFVYQWAESDWKIVEHHSSLKPENGTALHKGSHGEGRLQAGEEEA